MNLLSWLIVATVLGCAPVAAAPSATAVDRAPEGFAAGTLVLTAEGPRPVETVQVGDWVLAQDVTRGEWGLRPVLHTFSHEGTGSWLAADVALPGPRGPPTVGAGQRVWSGEAWTRPLAQGPTIRTYTFEVAQWHTYLVGAGRGWTLVHNQEATVTYYRVQGGEGQRASKPLVTLLEGGGVKIEPVTLNVSTGNLDHARHFLENRPGAHVVAFEVPLALHERMVAEAIPQLGYRANPRNQRRTAPKIVDPTTPGNSYELPKKWAVEFGQNASNGRVLSLEELRAFAPRGPSASPAAAPDFERARSAAEALFGRLKAVGGLADARLLIEPTAVVEATADPATRTVRVTTGLLDAVAVRAARSPAGQQAEVLERTLGVLLAHELAHLEGIRAELAADRRAAERLRALGNVPQAADLQRALALFAGAEPTLLERVKNFARYGTVRGRLRAFDLAASGQPDPLGSFRRGDGTLRWAPLLASRAIHESAGAGKFTLGLFVKELAVVLETGDESRIDEFFSGITSTDFWVHYGIFAKSARSAELLYGRTLGRYVKHRVASGLLRQNVALAAGLAVPQLLSGDFEAGSFAISLGALGLSSTAVRLGAEGLRWIKPIQAGTSRIARVGGFLAQVGETALVLYVADRIERTVRPALLRRGLRAELAGAAEALLAGSALALPKEELERRLAEHEAAWAAWREALLVDVLQADQAFQDGLAGLAERALEIEQEEAEASTRLREHPGLSELIEAQYGSVELYASARQAVAARELEAEVERVFQAHEAARGERIASAWGGEARPEALLAGWTAERFTWTGQALTQRLGQRQLEAALREVSTQRLQTYADEREVLLAAAHMHPDQAVQALLRAAGDRARAIAELEAKVVASGLDADDR